MEVKIGKGTPRAPQPPDPTQLAQAQGAANVEAAREAARLSQFNQITPYGTLEFTGEIGTPERTATTTLTPDAQAQLEAQQRLGLGLTGFAETQLPTIQETLGRPLSFEGLPGLGVGEEARTAAEQAVFQRGANLLDPEFDRQRSDLETSLANKGIPMGSPAYNEAMRRLDASQGLQRENLALSAVQAGGAEQARQFGLSQAARQQGIAEILQQRGQPINELAVLLGQSGQVGVPQFQQFASQGVQPANILGAEELAFGGRLNQYNQGLAQQRAMMQAISGIGQAATLGAFSSPKFFG